MVVAAAAVVVVPAAVVDGAAVVDELVVESTEARVDVEAESPEHAAATSARTAMAMYTLEYRLTASSSPPQESPPNPQSVDWRSPAPGRPKSLDPFQSS